MKNIQPKAFLIAETHVHHEEMQSSLDHIGIDCQWETEAVTDAGKLLEFAGKSCYMSFHKDFNKNLTRTGTRDNQTYLQEGIISHKHGSVLEHATVTFYLTNVSRVVTHELVRHRSGMAFSQLSGRYVRNNFEGMFIPTVISENEKANNVFKKAFKQMEENLLELEEVTDVQNEKFSLKKLLTSSFRRIFGVGMPNHIVVTGNHRSWRHIIETRTSHHAEEEIRVIIGDVAEQLQKKFPAIYADMNKEMINGHFEYTFTHSKV